MTLSIRTDTNATLAHRLLVESREDVGVSIARLSSGYAINRAADKPAGLIISEQLRAQIGGIHQSIENGQRASNIAQTAEGALQEINTILKSIRTLGIEAANSGAMDTAQIQSNQDQIDSALNSIDRIANTTTFAGIKLLDGSKDYTQTLPNDNRFDEFTAKRVQFGDSETVDVQVDVVTRALRWRSEGRVPNNVNSTTAHVAEITGPKGTATIVFSEGTTRAEGVALINAVEEETGLYARTNGRIFSRDFGADLDFSFESIEGADTFFGTDHLEGQDAEIIVNGVWADVKGVEFEVNTTNFQGSARLLARNDSRAGGIGTPTRTYTFTKSGMRFQLGSDPRFAEQENLGIRNMHSSALGLDFVRQNSDATAYLSSLRSGGENALAVDPDTAVEILDYAITEVTEMRAYLGAFDKNRLQSTMNNLRSTAENLSASESRIRDVDFAKTMMDYVRSSLRGDGSTSMLAQANTTQDAMLVLVG